jgi:pimeloyl-ACP methyl ester carboxylesterase
MEISQHNSVSMPGRIVETRGNRRVHVIEVGAGAPVLLLHGLGSMGAEMMAAAAPLAAVCRVLAVDRPGHGLSSAVEASEMAPDRQALCLGETIRALDLRRPVLVAHSIAAATALAYALDCPEALAGLVLLGPFCRPTRPMVWPLLRLAVAPIIGAPIRHYVAPLLAQRVTAASLVAAFAPLPVPSYVTGLPFEAVSRPETVLAIADELRGFNRVAMRLALRLRRLAVPTVVLAGEEDCIANCARHAAWVARRVPAARLLRLEGVGHMPHHTHAALLAEIVTAMVARRAVVAG